MENATIAPSSCVGAYFPPHIDYRADYLNHQCHYKYACHEMRYVHTLHNIHTDEIAKDRNDIWHHTALTLTEFDKSPTLVMAIETDEKRGKKDSEYIYKSKYHYLVRQWQKTQITERKQCYESHGGEVKGIENRAQHSRSQYYFIGSLHSSLFTLHSLLFPHPLHRYSQHLTVFRHRAPGYRITPLRQYLA